MPQLLQFRDAIAAATETFRSLSSLEARMVEAADLVEQCLRAGNKLLACGNGGSVRPQGRIPAEGTQPRGWNWRWTARNRSRSTCV